MKMKLVKVMKKTDAIPSIVNFSIKDSGLGKWLNGVISLDGKRYKFFIKPTSDEAYKGLMGTPIIKMDVRPEGFGSRPIINYDRGWDIRPKDDAAKQILKHLIDKIGRKMSQYIEFSKEDDF